MSVYRSTYALTKLFGITRAEGDLVDDENLRARYPFFGGLRHDITRVGYSTRLKYSEHLPPAQVPPRLDNLDAVLSSNLIELNAFIRQAIGQQYTKEETFPVVITHNFIKAEIDITAPSADSIALIEKAIAGERGQCYRDLAWSTFALLKSTADEFGSIYLINDADSSVTALSNASSLQLQIDGKPTHSR